MSTSGFWTTLHDHFAYAASQVMYPCQMSWQNRWGSYHSMYTWFEIKQSDIFTKRWNLENQSLMISELLSFLPLVVPNCPDVLVSFYRCTFRLHLTQLLFEFLRWYLPVPKNKNKLVTGYRNIRLSSHCYFKMTFKRNNMRQVNS